MSAVALNQIRLYTTLKQPLQSLHPLEVHASSSNNVDEVTDDQDHTAAEHSYSPSGRCFIPSDTEHNDVSDDNCDDSDEV